MIGPICWLLAVYGSLRGLQEVFEEFGIEEQPFQHVAGLMRASSFRDPDCVCQWARDHLPQIEEVGLGPGNPSGGTDADGARGAEAARIRHALVSPRCICSEHVASAPTLQLEIVTKILGIWADMTSI